MFVFKDASLSPLSKIKSLMLFAPLTLGWDLNITSCVKREVEGDLPPYTHRKEGDVSMEWSYWKIRALKIGAMGPQANDGCHWKL
jgi:hypothetical protein